jgi:hypothetical protein
MDFPSEWYRFANGTATAGGTTHILPLADLQGRLPFYARSVKDRAPTPTQVLLVPGPAGVPDGWKVSLRAGGATEPLDFEKATKEEVQFAQGYRLAGEVTKLSFDKDWVLELGEKPPEDGKDGGDGQVRKGGDGKWDGLGVLERMWLVVSYSLKATATKGLKG